MEGSLSRRIEAAFTDEIILNSERYGRYIAFIEHSGIS